MISLFQFKYQSEDSRFKESVFIVAPSMLTAVDIFQNTYPEYPDYDVLRHQCILHSSIKSF